MFLQNLINNCVKQFFSEGGDQAIIVASYVDSWNENIALKGWSSQLEMEHISSDASDLENLEKRWNIKIITSTDDAQDVRQCPKQS